MFNKMTLSTISLAMLTFSMNTSAEVQKDVVDFSSHTAAFSATDTNGGVSGAASGLTRVSNATENKDYLGKAAVEVHLEHYSLQPRSGTSFNRIEQLSIVMLANKLSTEFRSPYAFVYRIIDKEGNIVDGQKKQIMFTMCNDMMVPVQKLGKCGDYNNVATINLKTRQTRKPASIKGFVQEGRFWIKEEEVNNFPRFEAMEYKLDSYRLLDRSGKLVHQVTSD